jgi:hypothetical protein
MRRRLGVAPFDAAWILDDLAHILVRQRQPPGASAERWNALVSTAPDG